MFDDQSPWCGTGYVHVGSVTLNFLESEDGSWHSELEELDKAKCRGDLRTVYKLALCMAVVQDTLKHKMIAMDTIIKTNQELQAIQKELDAEKLPTKQKPDVDLYQQELPFEEE